MIMKRSICGLSMRLVGDCCQRSERGSHPPVADRSANPPEQAAGYDAVGGVGREAGQEAWVGDAMDVEPDGHNDGAAAALALEARREAIAELGEALREIFQQATATEVGTEDLRRAAA